MKYYRRKYNLQKVRDYDKIRDSLYIKFLKGFLIGTSVIIPGFCTALFSMILKEYDTLLDVIEGFYKPKIIKKHAIFISGLILGSISIILLMSYLFKEYRQLLECLFLGIAVNGLLNLRKKINKIKIVEFIFIVLGILLSVLPEIMTFNSTENSNFLFIIIGGILSSLAFIMPGVSGSMILLTLGVYPTIINGISKCLMFFVSFPDISQIIICLTFFISFVVASIIFSKLIKKILNKYEKQFIIFCLGLLIGTIGILFENIILYDYHLINKMFFVLIGFFIMKIFK